MCDINLKGNGREHRMPNAKFALLMAAVLREGKLFRFQASGFSMSPFIKDGDMITLKDAGKGAICFGDMVAAADPVSAKLVVHRVVGRKKNRCLVKGDRNVKPDGWMGREEVLGRVIRIERGNRNVSTGSGFERRLIGFLSRQNFLVPLIRYVWPIARNFKKRGVA